MTFDPVERREVVGDGAVRLLGIHKMARYTLQHRTVIARSEISPFWQPKSSRPDPEESGEGHSEGRIDGKERQRARVRDGTCRAYQGNAGGHPEHDRATEERRQQQEREDEQARKRPEKQRLHDDACLGKGAEGRRVGLAPGKSALLQNGKGPAPLFEPVGRGFGHGINPSFATDDCGGARYDMRLWDPDSGKTCTFHVSCFSFAENSGPLMASLPRRAPSASGQFVSSGNSAEDC